MIEMHAGQVAMTHCTTVALPDTLRQNLLRLANPSPGEIDLLGVCDAELGHFIGHAIKDYLLSLQTHPTKVRAIGSHGQTIRHRPAQSGTKDHTPFSFTMQIGDPNQIAEITGITTIADFRRRDVAAGGQGAPLVPPFHKVLFPPDSSDHCTVILNIGGISNISIIGTNETTGFDTGPGNGLMDIWCQRHRGQPFDDNGSWAAQGQVSDTLLKNWLADPYFSLPPPKSTGREYFNTDWLERSLIDGLSPVDVQASLTALTARCTTACLPDNCTQLVVCGGGRHNAHLLGLFAQQTKAEVLSCEALGIDGDGVEAAAFAWLAHQRLAAYPGNESSVTGAIGERVLGAVYFG